MIPWKVIWIAVGGMATLAAGLLPLAIGLDPSVTLGGNQIPLRHVIMIGVTVVLAGTAVAIAHNGVKWAVMFAATSDHVREQIVSRITLAILVHAAWVVALQIMPQWWPWWPLVVAAMSGLEYWAAVLWEWREVRRPRPHRMVVTADGIDRPLDDTESTFVAGLHRSGLGALTLMESEVLRERNG